MEIKAAAWHVAFGGEISCNSELAKHFLPKKTNEKTKTVAHIQLHDSYHNNLKFRTDYMAAFDEKPSVEPMIQFKWDIGSKLSDEEYQQACEEKRNFKEFLEREVFTDRTIMILPGGYPGPSYRDEVSR